MKKPASTMMRPHIRQPDKSDFDLELSSGSYIAEQCIQRAPRRTDAQKQ
jgi:hypothetical protein